MGRLKVDVLVISRVLLFKFNKIKAVSSVKRRGIPQPGFIGRGYAAKALDSRGRKYAIGMLLGDWFYHPPAAATRRVWGLGQSPKVCRWL